MRLAVAAVVFACAATPAMTDAAEDCLSKESGSIEARVIALGLIDTPRKMSNDEAKPIIRCLLHASGAEYQYDASVGIFYTSNDSADRAIRGSLAAKALAEAEAKAEEATVAAAEAARKSSEIAAATARAKAAREAEVIEQLAASCERLYRRDPDLTIANKLCFDVFFARGLPD